MALPKLDPNKRWYKLDFGVDCLRSDIHWPENFGDYRERREDFALAKDSVPNNYILSDEFIELSKEKFNITWPQQWIFRGLAGSQSLAHTDASKFQGVEIKNMKHKNNIVQWALNLAWGEPATVKWLKVQVKKDALRRPVNYISFNDDEIIEVEDQVLQESGVPYLFRVDVPHQAFCGPGDWYSISLRDPQQSFITNPRYFQRFIVD